MEENQIIFLDKINHLKIWGSEEWIVSAHPNGDCTVKSGPYTGKKLSWLWDNKRELFGNLENEKFPLLTKIINARSNLSIQVHPDDSYAKENSQGELGKTECWYILECEPDAEIILGHNAKTKEELQQMIETRKWDELLKRVKIKPGDFFYIPAGTVHGIGKGTVILENQQSSDVTYRVYDYHRKINGQSRELHIKESIDVITVPNQVGIKQTPVNEDNQRILVKEKYFTVTKIEIEGKYKLKNNKPFTIASVINGTGTIGNRKISHGDHFIIKNDCKELQLQGQMEIITTSI